MNWILDTYSNVYSTAMMRVAEVQHIAAVAKKMDERRSVPMMNRLFGRR